MWAYGANQCLLVPDLWPGHLSYPEFLFPPAQRSAASLVELSQWCPWCGVSLTAHLEGASSHSGSTSPKSRKIDDRIGERRMSLCHVWHVVGQTDHIHIWPHVSGSPYKAAGSDTVTVTVPSAHQITREIRFLTTDFLSCVWGIHLALFGCRHIQRGQEPDQSIQWFWRSPLPHALLWFTVMDEVMQSLHDLVTMIHTGHSTQWISPNCLPTAYTKSSVDV